MAWKKILNFPNTGFGTFLLAFAFVLFFSFFLGTRNSFALEDLSVDLLPSTTYTSNDLLFPNCDATCMSQYKYLIVKRSSYDNYNGRRLPLVFIFDSNSSFSISIPGDINGIIFQDFISFRIDGTFTTPSTRTYTLVLTNSLGSDCPVCEECQQCPAIPENPYDDKFDKIIVAIYTCGAIILVIYFFYCIYGMIIKSTGGK